MSDAIAIVGMACSFPDANTPEELWENALAERRAFRRIPSERLPLDDYGSPDRSAEDRTYLTEAAVLEGYEFDRARFRVPGSSYRAADPTHWLALDVADRALSDAGFPGGAGLPLESTGVVLGNTLTGEFSRANTLRLRWPYVRRAVEEELVAAGQSGPERAGFLEKLEARYKAPFPPVAEESLAGGLANTIAGRICNHFDLGGGGYTVDGACASSLLSVSNACSALVARDLDVALVGGVDLSLDPFELVGFARIGALATREMRVYDARSEGFWPGEGCGLIVLMRATDAERDGRRVYASIRGWGVSSDGQGGLTRPEVEGQLLALSRAYTRAGLAAGSVAYFEGHGTGTEVGDATELRVLSRARGSSGGTLPAAVGSIKANLGHTKAAAGAAGLIKATLALHHQIIPPTSGCERPHPELDTDAPALRVLRRGELWPADQPFRAAVSSMGFGGINTHVVLESTTERRRSELNARETRLLSSAQDAELFLLGAADAERLHEQVEQLAGYASRLSRAELGDLAAELARSLEVTSLRAAITASSPAQLARGLETLRSWLAASVVNRIDVRSGVFLGSGERAPRIGFLFPGQAAPLHLDGGAWQRRFALARELYACSAPSERSESDSTAIAQPAIATATLAGLRVLAAVGIDASLGLGHSLGELCALHWAGGFAEEALRRIATQRGRVMAELGSPGAMASLATGPDETLRLLEGESAVIAGLNSSRQTVVSGTAEAVERVLARARASGFAGVRLPVTRAFHSPLVEACSSGLAASLAEEQFQPLSRKVISTVSAAELGPDEDLRSLLLRQLSEPVRFSEAAAAASGEVDLWIEVGPGAILSGLMDAISDVPAIAIDAGGPRLAGLLRSCGAAFAMGAALDAEALFRDRFTRPFELDWSPSFLVNPCERGADLRTDEQPGIIHDTSAASSRSTLEIVRERVAASTELSVGSLRDDDRMLSDLHLSSIAVAQLVAEVARQLELSVPATLLEYADASLSEIATALDELEQSGGGGASAFDAWTAPGVDSWVRTFEVEWVEKQLQHCRSDAPVRSWRLVAPDGDELGRALVDALQRPDPIQDRATQQGILVHLPEGLERARCVELLLEGAHAALAGREPRTFVLVQHADVGGPLARTLHREARGLTTCVIELPAHATAAPSTVVEEVGAATGYAESRHTPDGRRLERRLRALPLASDAADLGLCERDVLLVTGGGKGIAAEAALNLARQTGARLALLGRSSPGEDPELDANLERMKSAGVVLRYCAADVCDAEAVGAAVRTLESELGRVTAFLHGAGMNTPRLLQSLDRAAFEETLAPKLAGAENVLAALDPARLRLLVTFGSVIAEIGMPGEADYALANGWLTRFTRDFAADHPECRCLALEWSIWSGVGMGERLGRVDALAAQGITAISPDQAWDVLQRVLATPGMPVAVLITGRMGRPVPTLAVDLPELSLLRFLDEVRVHLPGVELVVETDLSVDSDPYLADHVLDGARLVPGVMGLEAMAQVATALAEVQRQPIFQQVEFLRPLIVPELGEERIRIAALVRAPGQIDVVVRAAQTGFQVDHIRATCRFDVRAELAACREPSAAPRGPELELDPSSELYGKLLFHSGRFQRIESYRHIAATGCVAAVGPEPKVEWFGPYRPQDLLLADPGARDAAVHALQVCVPDATLLPLGVEEIAPGPSTQAGPSLVHAVERAHVGDEFTYDVDVTDARGNLRERWVGLRLHRVAGSARTGRQVAPLLAPLLERLASERIPQPMLRVGIERGDDRRASRRAIERALGCPAGLRHRPDGRPELDDPEQSVSSSHAEGWTLAVAGRGSVACDLEAVRQRTESAWRDLLGPDRSALSKLLASESGEDFSRAATRVWTAVECLKKTGVDATTPLVYRPRPAGTADACRVLSAGGLDVVTLPLDVQGVEPQLMAALLGETAR